MLGSALRTNEWKQDAPALPAIRSADWLAVPLIGLLYLGLRSGVEFGRSLREVLEQRWTQPALKPELLTPVPISAVLRPAPFKRPPRGCTLPKPRLHFAPGWALDRRRAAWIGIAGDTITQVGASRPHAVRLGQLEAVGGGEAAGACRRWNALAHFDAE
jgi:hypothetical protein